MILKTRIKFFLSLFVSASLLFSGCYREHNSTGEYVVREVVDGDTIELSNGARVRYIGIDTPESRKKVADEWVFDPEPYAIEAKDLNKSLVFGKKVKLEFDVEKYDKYGRWLAYVWVDGKMANEEILAHGYASVYTFPPNVKYADEMIRIQKKAMEERLGVWKSPASVTPQEAYRHIGEFCKVRGKVLNVRYATNKMYINFGYDYGNVLSVVVYKHNLVFFEKAGINVSALSGRKIEIIGKVRDQNGPRIIADNASQITLLE